MGIIKRQVFQPMGILQPQILKTNRGIKRSFF